MLDDILAGSVKLLVGCHARWLTDPPSKQSIFYANHSSHLDALIVWSSLPTHLRKRCRIVAAADYWTGDKWRRWLAEDVFRAVLIDRERINKENNPLRKMLEALDEGSSLVIFPEGGRQSGDEITPFRSGIWHLAKARPEIPLYPVWLENLNRIMPKGEFLPLPLIAAVTFGSSFQLAEGAEKSTFLEATRGALVALRGQAK